MKVELEIDHTISREEIQNWIDEVLKPQNPCVWKAEIENHNCGSCHTVELKKENTELKTKLESDELALNEAKEIVAELKAEIEKMKPYAKELCKNHKVVSLNHTNECFYGDCSKCDKWEMK